MRLHTTWMVYIIFTLPETKMAPENGWLEYDRFLLGFGLFSGAFGPVSFRFRVQQLIFGNFFQGKLFQLPIH